MFLPPLPCGAASLSHRVRDGQHAFGWLGQVRLAMIRQAVIRQTVVGKQAVGEQSQ